MVFLFVLPSGILSETSYYKAIHILSVDSNRLAHGGFNVERLDILPSLLQQGDQEVN